MSRLRVVGLALAAVFAMSAGGVASASAHEFVASEVGASLSGTVVEGVGGVQMFKTKAGTIECTALKITEGKTALKAKTQKATIKYEGCEAFGIPAEVSPAEFEFSAEVLTAKEKEEGKKLANVKLKAVTIKATSLCTVTIPTQTVGEVTYKNKEQGGKKVIELIPNVTSIMSSGVGFACTYSSESNGTYKGNSLVSIPGNIEWL